MKNICHLADCMQFMKDLPDNHYDLAIVDPPYGIGEDGGRFRDRKGGGHRVLEKKGWDRLRPSPEYFKTLERVSMNRIIWGANHLCGLFDASGSGWVYWDKKMGGDFSDGELASTSLGGVLRSFSFCNKFHGKTHPTQKPVALYKWLLANYAKPGDRIFDSHVGSGSIRIACHDLDFEFEGCEIDPDYHAAQEERFIKHTNQLKLF